MELTNNCVLCNEPGTLQCSKCSDPYCSADCQKLDWRVHKRLCKEMPKLIPLVILPNLTNKLLSIKIENNEVHDNKAESPNVIRNLNTSFNDVPSEREKIQVSHKKPRPLENGPIVSNGIAKEIPIVSNGIAKEIPIVSNGMAKEIPIKSPTPIRYGETIRASSFMRNLNKSPKDVSSKNEQMQFSFPKPANQPGLNEPYKYEKSATNNSNVSNSIAKEVPVVSSTTPSKPAENIKTNFVKQQPKEKLEIYKPEPEIIKSKVPSLVSDEIKSSTPDNYVTSAAPTLRMPNKPTIAIERSQPIWKTVAPFDTNAPSKLIVQYADEKNPQLLWTILETNEDACTDMLMDINKTIKPSTPSCSPDEIKINNLVAAPFEGIYYRAVILEIMVPIKEVLLRLLDYGNEFYAKVEDIKSSLPHMQNIHQFAFQVKLLEKRPIELGEKITIKFLSHEPNGIWIVTENLEMENKKTVVAEKPNYPIRADISTLSIPENVPLKLVLLDASLFLTDRFITASLYDEKILLELEVLNQKFATYCIEHAPQTPDYSPKVGEICCAIFADDGSWYRAECINIVSENRFLLKFIDYGNFGEVNSDDIRKIPREYLYQTSANACLVEMDFLPNPKQQDMEKIEQFLQKELLDIKYAKKKGDKYIISVLGLAEQF